jgi:dolichol-phosphate mannosyltransferase
VIHVKYDDGLAPGWQSFTLAHLDLQAVRIMKLVPKLERSPHPSPELVSVVAPVFNEATNLRQLHGELMSALDQLPVPAEILWVDDRSTDGSFELLQELCREAATANNDAQPAGARRVQALRLPRHLGQSAALWYGIQHVAGNYVATLDSDLQNDPADLPRLFEHLQKQDLDLVSGVRAARRDTWLKKKVSKVANRVRSSILGDPFHDVGCSLKIYRREFLLGLPPFNGLHRFLPVIAVWNGARCGELAVNHRPRTGGESKYGAIRGRLGRGIADLLAMLWLRSRWLAFDPAFAVHEELVDPSRDLAKQDGEGKKWTESPSGWSSDSSDSRSSSPAS